MCFLNHSNFVNATLKRAGRSWITLYKEQAVTKSKSTAVCQLSSGLRKNMKSQAFMDDAEGCIKRRRKQDSLSFQTNGEENNPPVN